MNSYASILENSIESLPCNKLIVISELYKQFSQMIPEQAFYKTIERLTKSGKIIHLTKGIYYRPKVGRFGTVPISEDEIASHYIEGQQGIEVGYRMFNRRGLTTQVGKQIEVLSNSLPEERKHIRNVSVQRVNLNFDKEKTATVEALEILQAYPYIEDINKRALTEYMEGFSRKVYSDETISEVFTARKYKKSTLAFMEAFLNYYHIKNSLKEYLSPLSKYNIPDVEGLYEITQ